MARKLLVINLMMKNRLTDNQTEYMSQCMSEMPAGPKRSNVGQSDVVKETHNRLPAAERLEAAGRLAGWVAHQINNPLGSISGNAQLLARRLQRDIADPDALQDYMRYIEGIQSHTERCARITGEMLNFTRPGEPELRKIEVPAAVREAMELVEYSYPDCRIELLLDTDLPAVRADREWLSRAVYELLVNAAQASEEKPVYVKVEYSTGMDESRRCVTISVKDRGKGIDADILPRIFDPYFTTNEKARGLGLTIALELIQRMGGDLELERSTDTGSIFRIRLPV